MRTLQVITEVNEVREENIRIVQAYLDALKNKDVSEAPFAEDIIFWDKVAGKTIGAENVRGWLKGFLPAVKDVKVLQHVCEGEWVCTRWECETAFGLIEIANFFRVRDGKISEAYGYLDPQSVMG